MGVQEITGDGQPPWRTTDRAGRLRQTTSLVLDGVVAEANRLVPRSSLFEASQEAGLRARWGMARRWTEPRSIPGVSQFLKSRLAARAPLHVVGDGLVIALVKLLIQQQHQLVERHTGLHLSILWFRARRAG